MDTTIVSERNDTSHCMPGCDENWSLTRRSIQFLMPYNSFMTTVGSLRPHTPRNPTASISATAPVLTETPALALDLKFSHLETHSLKRSNGMLHAHFAEEGNFQWARNLTHDRHADSVRRWSRIGRWI